VSILAGDVGGTHTRLALFDDDARAPARVEVFDSADHAGLPEMTDEFLADGGADGLRSACFGVAGPVLHGRTGAVNLAWPVDAAEMAASLGIAPEQVSLLNDLEANGWGIAWLGPDDLVTLQTGEPGAVGNVAVISAGTGLGQAGLLWDGHEHHVFATEGGHADFAPADALQDELLASLRDELGHVSVERVCSGMGIEHIERFLRARAGQAEPSWVTEAAATDEGAAAAIGDAGVRGDDPVAVQALQVMVDVYGAQAGNVALTLMALGGVYVGGGIAPKILPVIEGDGRFLRAFLHKGRFAPLLERIPLHVIVNDRTALLGAARHAESLALTVSGGSA
jgi:glucokinase